MKQFLLIAGLLITYVVQSASLPPIDKQIKNEFCFSSVPVTSCNQFVIPKARPSLKQKIVTRILQWRVKQYLRKHTRTNPRADKASAAFTMGLLGLIFLFIPILNFASIPLAILAIIFGNKAKKEDRKNKRARAAVTLGIVTLALLVTIGLIAAIVLTIGAFPM